MTSSPIDSDELAEAYHRALDLEKSGQRDEAIAAWNTVLALDPDDHGGATIRLAALGAVAPPRRMPDAYVQTLFDQHAAAFDDILVDQLGYAVPLMLEQVLLELGQSHPDLGRYKRGLDLGCGTGFAGSVLTELVDTMIGLDISEEMVALADDRDCYDGLYVAEAEDFLETIGDEEAPFDLIVATDVLPYMGDVSRLFAGMAAMSESGAVIGFSTETASVGQTDMGYKVLPTHRFAHDPAYVTQELLKTGFGVLHRSEITVRMEQGQPAPGHLFVARKHDK